MKCNNVYENVNDNGIPLWLETVRQPHKTIRWNGKPEICIRFHFLQMFENNVSKQKIKSGTNTTIIIINMAIIR